MLVRIIEGGKTTEIELQDGSTVEELLVQLGKRPDAHIVLRNEVPIPITERLEDGEEIKILRVASGG